MTIAARLYGGPTLRNRGFGDSSVVRRQSGRRRLQCQERELSGFGFRAIHAPLASGRPTDHPRQDLSCQQR